MYETLTTELTDGVMTITLNRPDKLNAFTPQMMDDIIAAFDATDADDAVRAVVVTGAGRAFCAGADLSAGERTFDLEAAAGGDASPVGPDGAVDWTDERLRDGAGRVTLRIFRSLKPVIGAINGAAVGVGATMLLPMDIRVASSAARVGFVFTRRGLAPEGAASWFLPRIVGLGQALEWCCSGRLFDAAEALEGGLVKALYAPDDLLLQAQALARSLVEQSAPVAVALTRQMFWRCQAADDPFEAHRIDSRGVFARGRSADVREGVSAFLEKRPPVFPDKVSRDMPDFFPWWSERSWA